MIGWRAEAEARLADVVEHGDDNGTIANLKADELRDVLRVASERLAMHAASHYDILTHFAKTDPDLVRRALAEAEASDCTGLSARWCPVHGRCTCTSDVADLDMNDPTCPLHATASAHGTTSG